MGYLASERHYIAGTAGNESWSCGKCGNSGRVPYDGREEIDIYVYVDSDPFENSIGGFNNSTNVLTGSVVTMNTAQCAAIQETATEVSTAMINGFFGLISTELSQQIQALDSAMKAGLGLLLEQGKAVDDKKNVMEGDYNRISSRYIVLFGDLDSECHKRIHALDKQSFYLSEKVQKELLSESVCGTAAMNLLGIEEVSFSKDKIFVSSLKRKALNVLKTMHDYITQELKINSLIDSLLFNEKIDGNISLAIPIIWSESDATEGASGNGGFEGTTNCECFVPEHIEQQGKQAITEKANALCSDSSRSNWEIIEETEKDTLNKEFNVLAEQHYANTEKEEEQRIYKTMLSLWQNSQLFSLKRSLS